MMAIIKVESGGNPLAINVNGSRRLTRQPKSKAEAMAWAEWLVGNGYSIDLGLTQVNSANFGKLRTSIGDMFDPCANLAAGGHILVREYAGAAQRLGLGQDALRAALSAYNTGNYRAGFANGYVARVVAAARPEGRAGSAPPLTTTALSGDAAAISPRVYWVKR